MGELFNRSNIDINCSWKSGPIYGDREIIATGIHDFYVTNKNGTKAQKEHGKRIQLDGRTTCALPIAMFGFTVENFKDVPLNKFGLKEVAKYENETLVVTANGLFVIYSGGLPSLQGLPSEISVVSSVWKDENGDVKIPDFTLYSKAVFNSHVALAIQTSFRDIPLDVMSLTHWTTALDHVDNEGSGEFHLCNHFEKDNYSQYVKFYPGFYKKHIEWYQSSLDKGLKFKKGDSEQLTLQLACS